MSKSVSKVSVLVRADFVVYDSSDAAVTGLINTDFTKRLAKNGANDVTAVTVTEVANGRYQATFTPASTGTWTLLVTQATHNVRGWTETWDVTTDGVVPADTMADHILRRSLVTAEASSEGDALAFRSLLGAIAKLVNKVSVAAGTLTVTKTDDTTSLGTQAVTTDATASPITAVDTV